VLHQFLIAVIAKAARQTAQQVDLAVRLAQQQRPPSLDTWPAVNPASTRREKWAVKEKTFCLHSVIRKAAFPRL